MTDRKEGQQTGSCEWERSPANQGRRFPERPWDINAMSPLVGGGIWAQELASEILQERGDLT